jgi:nitrile hydratase subunit beta
MTPFRGLPRSAGAAGPALGYTFSPIHSIIHAMTRGVHDLGGLPAGPVDLAEHERTFFDQRVDAMMRLLAHPESGHYTVDAMRRAIESLPRDDYFGLGYYERWLRAIRELVIEKGLVTGDELDRKLAALAAPGRQP